MTEQDAFNAFREALRIFQQQDEEAAKRISERRNSFWNHIPEDARTLYVHVSHRFGNRYFVEGDLSLVNDIQKKYGIENVLVTDAPERSGQSFYHHDERVEKEKRRKLMEPFAKFSAEKSIDVIIYLCKYICDGYQSPIFPEDVENTYHIWHAIRLAEQLKNRSLSDMKNLIVSPSNATNENT